MEGWARTFSNNTDFAKWALTKVHVPTTFKNYVHGKDAAQTVEKKAVQPSDERKSRLCSLLNGLICRTCSPSPLFSFYSTTAQLLICTFLLFIAAQVPEEDTFPKNFDPATTLMKRWNLRIVQKPGSVLTSEALKTGHRKATDAIIRAWTKDIESNNFILEKIKITEAEQEETGPETRDQSQDNRDLSQTNRVSNSQANQTKSQAGKRSKPQDGQSRKKRVIRDTDSEEDDEDDTSEEEEDLPTGS